MEQYERAVALWQSWQVRSAADIDLRLDSFRVLFAYNSGRIENPEVTYHDTREIFENGRVVGYTGSPRAIFEQQNQKLCYEAIKDRLAGKEPLSVELVREIHRILTSGTYDERRYLEQGERPGEFKKHDYVTGINEVGSPPDQVETDLKELLEEVTEAGSASPLKAGAYLHAQFEYIHPFADGNGRVGRTLLNYWLMLNDHPPLIVYNEDKQDYYKALQKFDEEEVLEPLVSFFRRETVQTWQRALEMDQGQEQKRKSFMELL